MTMKYKLMPRIFFGRILLKEGNVIRRVALYPCHSNYTAVYCDYWISWMYIDTGAVDQRIKELYPYGRLLAIIR